MGAVNSKRAILLSQEEKEAIILIPSQEDVICRVEMPPVNLVDSRSGTAEERIVQYKTMVAEATTAALLQPLINMVCGYLDLHQHCCMEEMMAVTPKDVHEAKNQAMVVIPSYYGCDVATRRSLTWDPYANYTFVTNDGTSTASRTALQWAREKCQEIRVAHFNFIVPGTSIGQPDCQTPFLTFATTLTKEFPNMQAAFLPFTSTSSSNEDDLALADVLASIVALSRTTQLISIYIMQVVDFKLFLSTYERQSLLDRVLASTSVATLAPLPTSTKTPTDELPYTKFYDDLFRSQAPGSVLIIDHETLLKNVASYVLFNPSDSKRCIVRFHCKLP